MQCILIFDQLNDILYSKCNKKFLQHSLEVAKTEGLVDKTDGDNDNYNENENENENENQNKNDNDEELTKISSNIVIQLFSPIITSQRLMSCQFGNSYTSIQCEDGVNLVFNEYMGYLFVYIGTFPVEKLHRSLGVCISFVKNICGPNVPMLKNSGLKSCLLSSLFDTWFYLQDSDQGVLVEAVEQLLVNNELSEITLQTLQDVVDKLLQQTNFAKIHALMMVKNKFVSLYSSRSAVDLTPADILFLGFLAESFNSRKNNVKTDSSDSELCYCFFNSNVETFHHGMNQYNTKNNKETINGVYSYVLLLTGNHPYAIHVGKLAKDVYLFLLFECGNSLVSGGLNDAFLSLNVLQSMELQRDVDGMRHAFEFLTNGMKKIFDGLKKLKNIKALEACQKNLQSKWICLRKKYVEFIGMTDSESMTQIESATSRLLEMLKVVLEITCLDETILLENKLAVQSTFVTVRNQLRDFIEFLQVKALRNFTLSSRGSLSINKYLEEFPGLVHFIYIDRYLHRIITPSLDFSFEEPANLSKKQLWSMINYSRSHLQEGHLSMIWKDTTFNYAYFLWFENHSGTPLKPKIYPTSVIKNLPPPGIIIEDFYKRLTEVCFPKMPSSRIRSYELFCIHLGLATSSCVLEHSRRLAATIWDVTGIPSNPTDFL